MSSAVLRSVGRIRSSLLCRFQLHHQQLLCNHKYSTNTSSNTPLDNTEKNTENQRPKGLTPDDPLLVASPTSKCIVGCTCSEQSPTVNWFYVTEGEAQTCNCGYYFKLIRTEPTDWIPEYSRVMYVDDKKVDERLIVKREMPFKGLFSRFKTKAPVPPPSMINNDNKQNQS